MRAVKFWIVLAIAMSASMRAYMASNRADKAMKLAAEWKSAAITAQEQGELMRVIAQDRCKCDL